MRISENLFLYYFFSQDIVEMLNPEYLEEDS